MQEFPVTTPEGLDEAGSLDREQFYAYTSLKDSLSKDIQDQIATREKYPDVSDIDTKETRRFVENLTFAEGGSTICFCSFKTRLNLFLVIPVHTCTTSTEK